MSKMSYYHNPIKSPYEGRLWHELLDSKAEQYPDTEAVIMYDMDMNRSTMTFAEYRDRSVYLAASLLELGMSRGYHVLLIGQTSLPCMVFSMALSRIGCNTILLGPGNLTQDKVDVLKTLDCRMIAYDAQMKDSQKKQLFAGITQLTQHNVDNNVQRLISLVSVGSVLEELGKGWCLSYESLLVRGASQCLQKLYHAQKQVLIDDPMVAVFTSGSTGSPKVVQHTVHSVVNFYTGQNCFDLKVLKVYNDRPFTWSFVFFGCQSGLFAPRLPVIVPYEIALSETTCHSVFEVWEKEKCVICLLSVFLIHKLHTEKLHLKYNLDHIKVFHLVGQRFSHDHFAKIFELFPNSRVLLTYGTTESHHLAAEIMTKEHLAMEKLDKINISPGVEIKIVDDEEKVVTKGIPGEIWSRKCIGFLEYLANPKATKEARSPTGWYRTGDIGIMYDDGKIKVLGRKKEIIKRAALKIFPAEIENVVLQHPNVEEVIVVGVPDDRLHEEICACVVLNDIDDEKTSLQKLEDWCREQWPPGPDGLSLAPKYFVSMKKMFLTSTAKVSTLDIQAEALRKLGKL